jgi:hypothetical protein
MENQINVGNQNTQQIGQNPISQSPMNPAPERSKIKYIAFGVAILFGFAVFGFGAYYFGKQSSKNTIERSQSQTFPSPTITENDVTAGWKTYNSIDNSVMFKYPEDWQAEKEGVFGSRTVTEFKYNNTALFELTIQGNYNQVTGKPYNNLVEFLGPRLNKSRDTFVDGQVAKKIEDQGDPGHVIPYEEVIVFTPDNKTIVSLYYESPYYDKSTANRILDQILLTFKFFNKLTPTPTMVPVKVTTYKTPNFSLNFPTDWKISTRQIEYYDFPTLELTKTGGSKMPGGYELPEVWIGSSEIYSTSGAICANEPECPKVDTISFTIKGENYSTDVFRRRQIWESGKFTGKYFYVFQIGGQSELDSIPSKPVITGQYSNVFEKTEIETILSSLSY